MPVVHPAEIWKESGRYAEDRAGAGALQGPRRARHGPGDDPRGGRRDPPPRPRPELPPAADDRLPLPDEVPRRAALPWRPDPGPRVRDEGLVLLRPRRRRPRRELPRSIASRTTRIFERLGLDAIVVGADVGIMGGTGAHEFMVLNEFGEDTLVLCDSCGYADNQQIAIVGKPDPAPEDLLPMEDVETPDATTIEELATFLGVPKSKTAKAAFFVTGDGQFVVAIVRGDYDVNETKLVNLLKAQTAACGRRPSRRSRRGAWRRATARRSAPAIPSSSSTSSWRGRRTSSPAPTGSGGTCRTSTCRATTRRTTSPRSRTPARATRAPSAAPP